MSTLTDALQMIDGEGRNFNDRGEPLLALFLEVAEERERQRRLFPEEGEHDLFVMYAALGEETGEVQKAALELRLAFSELCGARKRAGHHFREELIQVAALALKIVELADTGRLVLHHDQLSAPDSETQQPINPS